MLDMHPLDARLNTQNIVDMTKQPWQQEQQGGPDTLDIRDGQE